MSKVSVIIPVYNADKYLDDTIKSVINQTFSDIELLLVDDGSTDSSKSICQMYAKIDSRVKYYYQENKGVSSARNKGIEVASGAYILFVDADDLLNVTMVEKLVFDIENNGVDVAISKIKRVKNVNEIEILDCTECVTNYDRDTALSIFLKGGVFELGAWNKLFKRETIQNVKFAEERKINEDKLFCFEAFMNSQNVSFREEELYYYFEREDSVSRSFGEKYFDMMVIADEIYRKIISEIPHLEKDARYQKVMSAYYLAALIAERDINRSYRLQFFDISIMVNNIVKSDLVFSISTRLGICLLGKTPRVFYWLKSRK